MTAVPRDPARALELAGVSGRIATPAADVLRKVDLLVSGRAETFGLGHLLPASREEILDALHRLGGWRPAEGSRHSRVDPSGLVRQAQRAAGRLARACEAHERVLFATGHPTGPLQMYIDIARYIATRGAEVLHFAEDEPFASDGRRRMVVRYVGEVACLCDGANLLHTHEPQAMEYLLNTGPRPDLVVGDHGFAGAALSRGIDAVAVVDTNDPALILAWARELPVWPLLCDDNRPATAYEPLRDVLLGVTAGL